MECSRFIKYCVACILFVVTNMVYAQEIIMKDFFEKSTDIQARTRPKTDRNGNPCALIKVVIPALEGASFTGMVIDAEYTPGEYWVYVPEGTKKILLKHPNFLPKEIIFNGPVKGKCTYQVTLELPYNKSNITMVHFRTNVLKATLNIKGETFNTENGEFYVKMEPGEYAYKMSTDIPGFTFIEGSVNVSGNNYVEEIPFINLQTEEVRTLSIQTEKNVSLKLDGKLISESGNKSIRVPAGLHVIEATNGQLSYKDSVDLTYRDRTVDMSLHGTLVVVSPKNAEFTIKPLAGAAKPSKTKFKSGESVYLLGDYSITAKKKGYKETVVTVTVGAKNVIDNFTVSLFSKGDEYAYGLNGRSIDKIKAVKEYTKLSKANDDVAIYKLAECYSKGEGTPKSLPTAVAFWHKAAELGNLSAMARLREYDPQNSKTYNYAMLLAQYDDVESEFYLGQMLKDRQSYIESAKWFEKADKHGHPTAKHELGSVYFLLGKSLVEKRDYVGAVTWFVKADLQGYSIAKHELGNIYSIPNSVISNPAKAFEYYTASMKEGNKQSIKNVADCYYNGFGTEFDKEKAIELYESLSSVENDVKLMLAIYYYSQGAAKYDSATKWFFKLPADYSDYPEGIGDVFYRMGKHKWNEDVKQHIQISMRANAAHLFELALDNGCTNKREICKCLGTYYKSMQQYENAFKYFYVAMEEGDSDATFEVAYSYETGKGVRMNNAEAQKFYVKAGNKGNGRAVTRLGYMYSTGKGVQKNFKEAERLWKLAESMGDKTASKYLEQYYRKKGGFN